MSYFADKILRMRMKGEGDLKSQRNVVDVLDGRPLVECMLIESWGRIIYCLANLHSYCRHTTWHLPTTIAQLIEYLEFRLTDVFFRTTRQQNEPDSEVRETIS